MSQINPSLTNATPDQIIAYLSNTSAIAPPAGVEHNFVNPKSRGLTQIIVSSILLGIMLCFVLNRVYVKLILTKKVTWDDATMLPAVFASVAYYVSCTLGVQKGRMGVHEWDISILQASSLDVLIPSWLVSVLTPLAFLFLKTSFFILYLQIFDRLLWLRICSWIGLITTAVTYTVLVIYVFYFATPRRGESWLAHVTSDDEKHVLALSVPQSIIGLVIDLYILVLPVMGVSGLRMSMKRKIAIISVFLSGFMACVCSGCSIYFRAKLEKTADSTWALTPVNISTLSEMFVGVICACMPAAAYAARQQNSTWQKLLKATSYSFTSIRSTLGGSKYSMNRTSQSQVTENYPEQDPLRSTDRKYAQYFNLDDFTNTTTTQTTINASNKGLRNIGPGIQRQFDVDIERN